MATASKPASTAGSQRDSAVNTISGVISLLRTSITTGDDFPVRFERSFYCTPRVRSHAISLKRFHVRQSMTPGATPCNH
jgi:hypothetical protein